MTTQQSYDAALKQELGALIDAVELPDLQKRFLRLRWLDQTLWAERRAGEARNRYYALRMIAIIGGVLVPALIGFKLPWAQAAIDCSTFIISLVVAISLALDSFFRWGERWTHYRRMSEL